MTAEEAGPRGNAREAWSALVDGQADAAEVSQLCGQWRGDRRLRETWHAYHLIGDALRSDELAGGARDAAFVGKLRARLASEPVVLAPQPGDGRATSLAAASTRRRLLRRWAAPVGVAAGVALVAGTLTVTRLAPPSAGTAQASLSAAAPAAMVPVAKKATDIASDEVLASADGAAVRVVRDPRLDSYLAAHKQLQGANALGPTPEFLRSATYMSAASR